MPGGSEPVLLTMLDVTVIMVATMGVFAVPALLIVRQFRAAGCAALAVLAGIAVNIAVHTLASTVRS
jgi:hypothetical protein